MSHVLQVCINEKNASPHFMFQKYYVPYIRAVVAYGLYVCTQRYIWRVHYRAYMHTIAHMAFTH